MLVNTLASSVASEGTSEIVSGAISTFPVALTGFTPPAAFLQLPLYEAG